MEIADDTSALGSSGEFAQYFARNVSQAALVPAMSSSLGNGVEDSEGFSVRSMGRNNSQARAAHPDPCFCVSLAQHSHARSATAEPHTACRCVWQRPIPDPCTSHAHTKCTCCGAKSRAKKKQGVSQRRSERVSRLGAGLQAQLARAANLGSPLLSKLESIASSAVRAADKVGASLIIVYTQSGAPLDLP